MDQNMMLHRILQILNQKIAMGGGRRRRLAAGEGEGYRRKRKVRAMGEGRRKKRAGVYAGEGRRKKRAGVSAGASPWIRHVKKYAKDHNISYKDALSRARASYRG